MCGRLAELTNAIKTYATRFDAGALSGEQAAEVVAYCSVIDSSIAAVKALAATKAASTDSWKSAGYRSAADELASRTGTTVTAARATLEIGRRLATQPEVAAPALSGELSSDKAALVANGAEAAPGKTADLLQLARTASVSELTDAVAKAKAENIDLEERRRRVHAARRLRSWSDLEGIWRLVAQGVPEDGARTRSVISAIRRALIVSRRQRGISGECFDALDYDALMTLVEIALGSHGELGLADLRQQGLFPDLDALLEEPSCPKTSDEGSRWKVPRPDRLDLVVGEGRGSRPAQHDAARPGPIEQKAKPRRRGALSTQIQVRVDLDALLRGVPREGELCEIVGAAQVPLSVIDDLVANDNVFISAVLTKAGAIAGVYHHGRVPTAKQKSGLSFFYPSCAVTGCNAKSFLQNDHRVDWSKTHFTVYDLMDRLCSHHHRMKTNHGWALVEGTGKRAFVPPDDVRHPSKCGSGHDP